MLLKSLKWKRQKAAIVVSLLSLSAPLIAADLTPGLYSVWIRPTETAATEMSALFKQRPAASFCVTSDIASNPLVLTGSRPDDAGCTASKPVKVSANAETFSLSCPQIQTTGAARTTRNGDAFVTVIEWRARESIDKSVVTGVRLAGCTK
jgi:hypothetical protein